MLAIIPRDGSDRLARSGIDGLYSRSPFEARHWDIRERDQAISKEILLRIRDIQAVD
jgi:hypothetical protein